MVIIAILLTRPSPWWPVQDIRTRQMIGYGVRQGKLYYLDLVSDSSKKLTEALTVADSQEERNQETICLNKSYVPFQIIHSDVWGPSTLLHWVDHVGLLHSLMIALGCHGYGTSQKWYCCYQPPSQTMYVTQDVVSYEDTIFSHEPELQGEHQKEYAKCLHLTNPLLRMFLHHQRDRCPIIILEEVLVDSKRKNAMNEEMRSLQKNGTWEFVDLPTEKKPIGCRWIYIVKYKVDGIIERLKARFVAKGYTQTYGIDYMEAFAPVAKINTVHVLLSLAVNLNWPLQQFEVKKCFSSRRLN
ncbi:unnamed protein product [Prunus armeniaca]